MNAEEFLKKKHNYAGIFDEYIKKWGRNDSDVKQQLGLKYRAFTVFMENGKWKKLLKHPILFFLVGLIRLITFASYWSRPKS